MFNYSSLQQLYSGYTMYSNYHGYKTLTDIENTYSESTLDEELPVAYKYFKGACLLFSFSVFLASSPNRPEMHKQPQWLPGSKYSTFCILA